jgi:hypothetical protein
VVGGLPPDTTVSERTHRGIKALKTASRRNLKLSGGRRTRGVTAGGHRTPKGASIAVEGNPLQGEAQGRSSVLDTLAGM